MSSDKVGGVAPFISAGGTETIVDPKTGDAPVPEKKGWYGDTPMPAPTPTPPPPEGTPAATGDDDPPDKAEPGRPRAFLVAYGDPSSHFSMVGESQIEVVKMIENLKAQYHSDPGKFAPVLVLNHNTGETDTAWLIPDLLIGVFHEYVYREDLAQSGAPEAGGLPDFLAQLMANRGQQAIILGAEGDDKEEALEIDPSAPTLTPDNDDDGGSSGSAA